MLHHIEFDQWVPFPLEKVFLFFAEPRNLPRLMPPDAAVQLGKLILVKPPDAPGDTGGLQGGNFAGVGSQIPTYVRVLPFLPFRLLWIARVTEFEWNNHFADVQTTGPFKSFHHRHQLTPKIESGGPGTIVRDMIDLDVGFGWLGDQIFKFFILPKMRKTFLYRQKVLPQLLSS